jgi:SAM-dependent methyltransferase
MDENEIKSKMAAYEFYHIIKLTDEISTPGNPRHVATQDMVMGLLKELELKGKRVLDIGCRDGLFSFEAERMGATEVIAIDNDLSKPAIEFLIPYFNSGVKMHEMNLYDLTPNTFGLFDVVIFAGVLYHLRYPLWAMKIIRDIMGDGGERVLETAIWRGASRHAMLYCPVRDESPYDPTSCSFFNEKGLLDTLASLGFRVKSLRYQCAQKGVRAMLRYLKQWGLNLCRRSKTASGRININRINRAAVVATLTREAVDQKVKQYWEGLHDFHTGLGHT